MADVSLWGGRFAGGPSPELARLSRSEPSEFSLTPYDIEGGLAHLSGLRHAGLVDDDEALAIASELRRMQDEFLAGSLTPLATDEDPPTFLERVLIERLGPVGGKIRAGRSRNDQAANTSRLFMRDHSRTIAGHVLGLVDALLAQAQRYAASPSPGFTHLQSAQPVTFGHQLLAHAQPLYRDLTRLIDWDARCDYTPLGSAALAGSAIVRDPVAGGRLMGYSDSAENSIDAVGSRDAGMEFSFVCASIMVAVSRLSEELVLWTSQQFGWVRMDDAFSSGSSIMPQKKNPDIAELARGKAGRVVGGLMAILAVMKGLPMALNRDMQEDKRPIIDAVQTIDVVLPALTGMVTTLEAREEIMYAQAERGFALATEIADWLAWQGVPFNEAHDIAGAVVRRCEERGADNFAGLGDEDLSDIDPRLNQDVRAALTVEAALAARDIKGGTAPHRVQEQIVRLQEKLEPVRVWIAQYDGPRFPLQEPV